jgi:hypothetical protein
MAVTLQISVRRVFGLLPGLMAEIIRHARARAFLHQAGKDYGTQ